MNEADGVKRLAEIATSSAPIPDRVEATPDLVKIGQWFWVARDLSSCDCNTKKCRICGPRKRNEKPEWLGCVVHVGSNFAKLKSPTGHSERIHLDNFDSRTRIEPNYKEVIESQIRDCQASVGGLLGEVKELTARLGVGPSTGASDSTALAVLSGAPDVKEYENALVRAKEDELPELFEKIKKANEKLADWMTAEVLPLKAMAHAATGVVEEIEGRIFNVSLYAGLTEDVVKIRKGEPAPYDAKLHVMQRRLYMDEECLLNYRHGGMDFDGIKDFDKWLAEKENRDRVLPFPRCLIAMRVRREVKSRDWAGDLGKLWINLELEDLDKLTFLYFRNGNQMYRLNCSLEFGELIFPPKDEFDQEPQMALIGHEGKVEKFMSVREYGVKRAEEEDRERKKAAWFEENKFETWVDAVWLKEDGHDARHRDSIFSRGDYERANPFNINWYDPFAKLLSQDWRPFDQTSVFYDECMKDRADAAKKWNRIALIIQGLFDRSTVFHPHPPVVSWTAEGFAAAIELVYDGSHNLHAGDPPDFDAYRRKGLESLGPGSVTIGQEGAWLGRERKAEANRRLTDNRVSWNHKEVGSWWKPHNDKGPGYIARVASWEPKKRAATFLWLKNRKNATWRTERVNFQGKFTLPAEELFNVSAYRPGDYLQFFADARTREQYLQWAPTLLAAEEYYAGNLKVQEPAVASGKTETENG